eukprot:COSAG02_NODE_423_length_22576_cov_62.034791_9_plen_85_part_00
MDMDKKVDKKVDKQVDKKVILPHSGKNKIELMGWELKCDCVIHLRDLLGRYVVGRVAFEPLQRRSAGFHRPDIVESLKCTAVVM